MSLTSVLDEGNGKKKERRRERRKRERKEKMQNVSPRRKVQGKNCFYVFEDENPHTSNSIIAIVISQTGIV